ncbi:hypothetical protein [Mucilaginibacter sp.]
MKKLYFTLVVLLFLSSCSGIHYQMGQTAESFLRANHNRSFDLVRSSNQLTVYKWVNNWSYTDPPYFFYFRDGFLYQVDRGERAPDIIIQNR